MLEAFNELMADPASRAEIVGTLIEALIVTGMPAANYLTAPVRKAIRRLRYGTDRPRVIEGHAASAR